jgi:uncharacterized protein
MNEKIVVIYHRADFDGIFCREIARKFLPDAILIGWDYGDPIPTPDVVSSDDRLYMLDISIEGLMDHPKLIWIDHHKSAMEKFHHGIPGYRIDGVAACRLAWQWFTANPPVGFFSLGVGRVTEGVEPHNNNCELPLKDAYVDRKVSEPLSVQLAGEYDIWDKRDPRAELFQHGLRGAERDFKWLLSDDVAAVADYVELILEEGRAIAYAKSQENAGIITSYGFDVEFEGLKFLACNHARFNSHLFTAGIRPEHDALLGFNFDGPKGTWRFSLYHAPGKEQHDLSVIATKYGGGGHRGACGFRCKTLPFEL